MFRNARKLIVCSRCFMNLDPAIPKSQSNAIFKPTSNRILAGLRTCSSKANSKSTPGPRHVPLWARLGIVSAFVGGCYLMVKVADHNKEMKSEEERYIEWGKINFGGDWDLTDHNGKRRTSREFRGQWLMIYFGFTHCPDICPEELDKLGEIVDMFDKDPKLPTLQPLFITLDPERDTVPVIKDYLKEFTSLPTIVGFTATFEELKDLAKRYRVYFGQGERDENNDYIIDHSIIIYLVNPDGAFVNYYDRAKSAEIVKNSVIKHINKYHELKKKQKL